MPPSNSQSTSWSHPILNTLRFTGMSWEGQVFIPPFSQFAEDPEDRSELFDIEIEHFHDTDVPAPTSPPAALIDLALQIVTQADKLVPQLTQALFDDITGRGPDSGNWWHNNLAEIRQTLDDHELRLKTPADLLRTLTFQTLRLLDLSNHATPTAELTFHCLFEEEHGLSFLFSNHKILGIGYAGDVTPFDL